MQRWYAQWTADEWAAWNSQWSEEEWRAWLGGDNSALDDAVQTMTQHFSTIDLTIDDRGSGSSSSWGSGPRPPVAGGHKAPPPTPRGGVFAPPADALQRNPFVPQKPPVREAQPSACSETIVDLLPPLPPLQPLSFFMGPRSAPAPAPAEAKAARWSKLGILFGPSHTLHQIPPPHNIVNFSIKPSPRPVREVAMKAKFKIILCRRVTSLGPMR